LLPFPNDNRGNGASLVLKSVKREPISQTRGSVFLTLLGLN
jgi:hypothetical protein